MVERSVTEIEFYRRVWHQKPALVRRRLRRASEYKRRRYRERYQRAAKRIRTRRPSRAEAVRAYQQYWCLFKVWGLFRSDKKKLTDTGYSHARWEAVKYYLIGDPFRNPEEVGRVAVEFRERLIAEYGENYEHRHVGMKVIRRAGPEEVNRTGHILRTFNLDRSHHAGGGYRLRTRITKASQWPPRFTDIAYTMRLSLAPSHHITVDYDGPVTAGYDLIARRGERAHTIVFFDHKTHQQALRERWDRGDDRIRAIMDRARLGDSWNGENYPGIGSYRAYHAGGTPNPEKFPYGTGIIFDWKDGHYYSGF